MVCAGLVTVAVIFSLRKSGLGGVNHIRKADMRIGQAGFAEAKRPLPMGAAVGQPVSGA